MTTLRTELLFEMNLDLAESQQVGETPRGIRTIAPLAGGRFDGPKLRGEVLAAGAADWLLTRPDGVRELDVRLTLRTDDGALIYMSYRGLNTMTPEMLQRLLRGEPVDPSEYYMRIAPFFETAAPAYQWLNRTLAVGTGQRFPKAVRQTVFAVL